MSNVIDKIKAKVENVLHSNDSTTTTTTTTHHNPHNTTTTGTTGTNPAVYSGSTGPATATAGGHTSNIANKLDPRVDSDLDGSGRSGTTGVHNTHTTGTTGTNPAVYSGSTGPANASSGPHSSNIANKLDPRVDSDLDGSGRAGGNYNTTTTGTNPAVYSGSTGPAHGTSGPHTSNIANKLDPRVDSDLDGSGRAPIGNTHTTHNTTTTTTGTHPSAYSGSTGPSSSTAGPHNSNLLNKLDPRVDSDLDGSRNAGMAQTGPGAVHNASTGPASHTSGHHGSNLMNKLDPRVDSDNSQHHAVPNTGAHPHFQNSGVGNAPNTQGPHNSDLLNKLDPRFDSTPGAVNNTTGTTGFNNNPNTTY